MEDGSSDGVLLSGSDAVAGPTWDFLLQLGRQKYVGCDRVSSIWVSSSAVRGSGAWVSSLLILRVYNL